MVTNRDHPPEENGGTSASKILGLPERLDPLHLGLVVTSRDATEWISQAVARQFRGFPEAVFSAWCGVSPLGGVVEDAAGGRGQGRGTLHPNRPPPR